MKINQHWKHYPDAKFLASGWRKEQQVGIFWGQEVKLPQPTGSVWRANLDGSERKQLAVIQQPPGGGLPTCMAIAPQEGKLYWSDDWTDDIRRMNIDGSNIEVAVEDAFVQNHAVGVDELAGQIYRIEALEKVVRRFNLDGSDPEDISGPLEDVWRISASVRGAQCSTSRIESLICTTSTSLVIWE